MVAVSLSNFTIRSRKDGEWETLLLQSPSTMDSADTVDITEVIHGRTIVNIQAWDTTTGDSVTATLGAGDVITVDAAGGGTNAVYVIRVDLLHI